jgi:hypothetical protein
VFTAETLTTVLTGILLPSTIVITLTFVPSIIELKRPKDAGPRPIPGFYKTVPVIPKSSLHDLDTEIGVILKPKCFSFPVHIVNLEA